MKNTKNIIIVVASLMTSFSASAATVALTGQDISLFQGPSPQGENFTFVDGLGNSVTIAITLASSSGGNLDQVDGNTGLVSDTGRAFVWDNQTGVENALFTATVASSSALVDVSSIEFRIDALGIRFTEAAESGELDWVSDGVASGTTAIIGTSGDQDMVSLDDQFHNMATQYDGAITMNNSGTNDLVYQMRYKHNTNGTTLGMNMTAQFTPVPEPSSAALIGLGGIALILRRRK